MHFVPVDGISQEAGRINTNESNSLLRHLRQNQSKNGLQLLIGGEGPTLYQKGNVGSPDDE